MAGPSRELSLSFLAAANNHGDLAVKLSSLKQAKDVLLSLEPSSAAELFPYLVELQSSPESLVRKALIEVIDEIIQKAMEHSSLLIPVLLTSLRDSDSIVARQSILAGTNIFYAVLEELMFQFHRRGIVEQWLEGLWTWMVKFKDAVFGILAEAGSVGSKLLAIKFVETYVILFASDSSEPDKPAEVITRNGHTFDISWVVGGHPILDPAVLKSEANRSVSYLINILQSAGSLPGSVTISVINCLAAIARKRPVYYSSILSALFDFNPNFEALNGVHNSSIQYAIRTAFLGFLRSTHPAIIESRERLLRALRELGAGDAADQVIRQVDKMIKNSERTSRDVRLSKDDQPSTHLPVSGDLVKKRPIPPDSEEQNNGYDVASKRNRYNPSTQKAPSVTLGDSGQDYSVNGVSPKVPWLDSNLTPVEQVIAMIGIFISEGERGAKSLEILMSNIPPDLLADIVITNMRHLPKNPPPLTRLGSLSTTPEIVSSSSPVEGVEPISSAASVHASVATAQVPLPSSNATSTFSDPATSISLLADSKRDPRRDPRRLDPRRLGPSVGVPCTPILEDDSNDTEAEFDCSSSLHKPVTLPVETTAVTSIAPSTLKSETELRISEDFVVSDADQTLPKEEFLDSEIKEVVPDSRGDLPPNTVLSPVPDVEQDKLAPKSSDAAIIDEVYSPPFLENDELSPPALSSALSEEDCPELPILPSYVELTTEQQKKVRKLACGRIISSYKHIRGADSKQTRMALLARLVAQIDTDDNLVAIMQTFIVSDYELQKGHELAMHVLYHLHSLILSDSNECSSNAAVTYENFLLGLAKSLLETLPANDKSFSKLLGEVPFMPDSALNLLSDLCSNNIGERDDRDGDRVTQGLGALWSLVLARPLSRQALLDIALKCAVHLQDDIRTKAIRLVANKLYVLKYMSEKIEHYATDMFLSAVDQRADMEFLQSGATEKRTEQETGSQETSISGSQTSELRPPSISQSDYLMSLPQAQRCISLYFALCTKKPSLLQLVFDNYGRSSKAVKQAVHRHIPILLRALGSSFSELLQIISDPPQGSENLLTQVLHILFEGTTPSSDLIATVKHLYETKLKDAAILIPMLSSFSKDEVLPIFPRLVNLPLDKFQIALAHILQGSAHTGPALTPTEVLIAIHDINPEKDGIPLKKITDACSACFEQRTVFTQQVLAKALNQMVGQTPLPLLFMRTVIQAIDAFPTLVDFVMEILSQLVSKQIWRMPKLWVGFLKCISQTQPHSFHVLLQLPPPQLESALNKYANLRGPLSAYAKQPSIRNSLSRSALGLLGLANDTRMQQPPLASSLHASDTSSSAHGAALT